MQFYYIDGQLETPEYVRGFILGYLGDESTAESYMNILEANKHLLLGNTAIIASERNLANNSLYTS